MPKIDYSMIGKTFNHLTVLEYAKHDKSQVFWKCRCVCSREVIMQGGNLKSGHSKSCGCIKKTWKQNRKERGIK